MRVVLAFSLAHLVSWGKKLEENDSKNDKHTSFGCICKYIRKHDPEEVSLKSKSKQGIPENEAIQT